MDVNIARARALANLPDFDSKGFGLGALPLNRDARDLDLASIQEVAELLRDGFPSQATLWDYVLMIYNQGSQPSCVPFSVAAMQSVFEHIEHGWWGELDAEECYWANGGDGTNGVETRQVLQWEQNVGMYFLNTGRRYRIGSFAFADPRTDAGVNSIKAAVAAKRPCVLALLLPEDFWAGDSTGAVVTRGYHQICVTGYTPERLLFVNSWGVDYGNGGFGSIPWSFLRKPEQTHFTYAFTAIDAIDTRLQVLNAVEPHRSSRGAEKRKDNGQRSEVP
jgi:hypothetical protein